MRYSSIKFGQGSYAFTPLVYEIGISDGDDMKLIHGGDLSLYVLRRVEENGMRLYAYAHHTGQETVYKLFIPETHQYFNAGMFIKRCRGLKGHIEGGYRVADLLYDVYNSIRKTL